MNRKRTGDHTQGKSPKNRVPTTRIRPIASVESSFRLREAEAQLLAEYARRSGPVILGGDANSVSPQQAYRILTKDLGDAWTAAGFGLGHTFPGSAAPGSSRPRLGPWHAPRWMARIDYIFYSNHWMPVSARMALIDSVSDHRGVVAVLQLQTNRETP